MLAAVTFVKPNEAQNDRQNLQTAFPVVIVTNPIHINNKSQKMINAYRKCTTFLLMALLTLAICQKVDADVIVDNSAATAPGFEFVNLGGDTRWTSSFTLGSSAFTLDSVTLSLRYDSNTAGSDIIADLTVYNDNGSNQPDFSSPFQSFDNVTIPFAAAPVFQNVTFTPSGSAQNMTANTNYWVGAEFVSAIQLNVALVNEPVDSNTGTAGTFSNLGLYQNSEATPAGNFSLNMRVQGSLVTVPEPSSFVLLGLCGGIAFWRRKRRLQR